MATILTNAQRAPSDPNLRLWYYCGVDCGVTREVWSNLHPKLDDVTSRVYVEERSWQAPAMAMQLRGIAVDDAARRKTVAMLKREAKAMQADVAARTEEMSGAPVTFPKKSLSPSWRELQKCFYERMKIPPQRNRAGKVSTDAETLARIARKWPRTAPVIDTVLRLRDQQKQIESMETGLSPDGRMRASWNVGQTETGRWASSRNCYGNGTNLQNQQRRLRNVYVADPGFELVNIDLAQAESRVVAYLAGDEGYIAAHERGNVHVEAARIFWPGLPWSGDAKRDKAMLKATPVPWKPQDARPGDSEAATSYYDASKRRQHGANYGLTPRGVAIREGVRVAQAEAEFAAYFGRYPRIKAWHRETIEEIRATGVLESPLGFRRQFFGRPWDAHTHREAIAFVPQSTVSHINKIALARAWRALDPARAQLLAEGHDSSLWQVRAGDDETARALAACYRVEVPINGRVCVIPAEVARGPNWRDLKEWKG